MKTSLLLLMAVVCGSVTVEALQCYACSSSSSNAQCNTQKQNCSSSDDTCMTTVTTVLGICSITKLCSTSVECTAATSTNINVVIGGNQVSCCMTDLCNLNGAPASGLSLLLLSLPLGLAGRLLSV